MIDVAAARERIAGRVVRTPALVALDVSGPLNVAGGDDVSRAELAELAAARPVRRVSAPPGRPLDCALDSSRARSLLRTELRGVRTVFA